MLKDLFARNLEWARAHVAADPEYFRRLAAQQAPEYLWIGCADSRVPANVITGLDPGEVFVHRNVANLVHPADMNCLAVLQFAVEVLKVRHIIVCGHYGCGGVHAAMSGEGNGLLDHWLEPIRELARQHDGSLAPIQDQGVRLNRLCELNVAAQVRRVAETPIVRQAWARGHGVAIHGWVYGINDGLLRDLECGVGGAS